MGYQADSNADWLKQTKEQMSIFAGLFPAIRAMGLSPLAAIKNEPQQIFPTNAILFSGWHTVQCFHSAVSHPDYLQRI